MPAPPELPRTWSEWAARWIVWFLAIGVTAVFSAIISGLAAFVVLLGLAKLGVRAEGPYAGILAWMVAPIPVLLVSYARAPACRWIVTAALCAAVMLFFGLPWPDQKSRFLWLLGWAPSWVTLGLLLRDSRARRAVTVV